VKKECFFKTAIKNAGLARESFGTGSLWKKRTYSTSRFSHLTGKGSADYTDYAHFSYHAKRNLRTIVKAGTKCPLISPVMLNVISVNLRTIVSAHPAGVLQRKGLEGFSHGVWPLAKRWDRSARARSPAKPGFLRSKKCAQQNRYAAAFLFKTFPVFLNWFVLFGQKRKNLGKTLDSRI
jgi:hypothetical protein